MVADLLKGPQAREWQIHVHNTYLFLQKKQSAALFSVAVVWCGYQGCFWSYNNEDVIDSDVRVEKLAHETEYKVNKKLHANSYGTHDKWGMTMLQGKDILKQ